MVTYDPAVIQQYAERLYRKANGLILSFGLFGMLVGGCGGYIVGRNEAMAFFGMAICGVIGAAVGQARAFQLKLQAQIALCQLAIEGNTRASAIATAGPAPLTVPRAA